MARKLGARCPGSGGQIAAFRNEKILEKNGRNGGKEKEKKRQKEPGKKNEKGRTNKEECTRKLILETGL